MSESLVADAPVIAHVTRDGFCESAHRGHVVIADADGIVHASLGNPALESYPRSSLKPFQALATASLLADAGLTLDIPATAITCASHSGTSEHQVEAARILADVGLDEEALRCPVAYPSHRQTAAATPSPTRLAHNCSGKHAGFIAAQAAVGEDPAKYLDPCSRIQALAAECIREACDAELLGVGVDGCGAPAWRLELRNMAAGFAKLAGATGDDPLAPMARAMRTRPDLVGGMGRPDTQLMLADARVVAKGGAEAYFAAGFVPASGAGGHRRPLGIAVKIADAGSRAIAPVVGTVLSAFGIGVDDAVIRPVVLGGGMPHGHITAADAVAELGTQVG